MFRRSGNAGQHPSATGPQLLLCGYVHPDGTASGDGETVLILDEGTGARQILGETVAPVRAVVVGIVDELEMSGA